MSDTYTKLFSSLTASTIVSEPLATRWLWVTMLAMADARGAVYASIPGLARIANITLEQTETALTCFLAPDAYSRTQDNDGRRIEPIDGGWKLLNHGKYSAIRSAEERREYMREYMRQKRAKEKVETPEVLAKPLTELAKSTEVTPPALAPTPDKAKEQKKEQAPRGARLPPDWQPSVADLSYAASKRPDIDVATEAENFRDHWHAKPGKDALKLDWPATWRKWVRSAYARPMPRAGPQVQQPGKTMQGIMALEEMKRGLAGNGNSDGVPKTALLGLGAPAGS